MLHSVLLSPILPYWLRMRYYVYRALSNMRRHSIVEKYRRMHIVEKWKKEEWTVL